MFTGYKLFLNAPFFLYFFPCIFKVSSIVRHIACFSLDDSFEASWTNQPAGFCGHLKRVHEKGPVVSYTVHPSIRKMSAASWNWPGLPLFLFPGLVLFLLTTLVPVMKWVSSELPMLFMWSKLVWERKSMDQVIFLSGKLLGVPRSAYLWTFLGQRVPVAKE